MFGTNGQQRTQAGTRLTRARAGRRSLRLTRCLSLERLEDRQLLASSVFGQITGTVWHDGNGNGKPDSGEARQTGALVYADANRNQRLDWGESWTYSGRNGSYRLTAPAGTYSVIESLPRGWQVTSPSSGSYPVTLAAGRVIAGKDFGNQRQQTTTTPSTGDIPHRLDLRGTDGQRAGDCPAGGGALGAGDRRRSARRPDPRPHDRRPGGHRQPRLDRRQGQHRGPSRARRPAAGATCPTSAP